MSHRIVSFFINIPTSNQINTVFQQYRLKYPDTLKGANMTMFRSTSPIPFGGSVTLNIRGVNSGLNADQYQLIGKNSLPLQNNGIMYLFGLSVGAYNPSSFIPLDLRLLQGSIGLELTQRDCQGLTVSASIQLYFES